MPALSSTMKEGKVVSWLKAEGDKISAGEPIMVVESDKVSVFVTSLSAPITVSHFIPTG
jgi:pyruvate dehydrogenase E2 component (dihydrolipoamide acetyltransferase)